MATTKDRLEQLTNVERELHDREVVALEDIWGADAEGPSAAAGQGPAVTIPRSLLGSRLLEPISGRWAAIGGIAWVVLLGIGIAVEPPPTNPDAIDPWFVDALGAILLAAVVGAFAGFWLRRRWSLAASLMASGLLVASTPRVPSVRPPHPGWRLVGRPAGLWAGAGGDQHPWTAARLNRGTRSDRLVRGRRLPPVAVGHASPPRPRSVFHPNRSQTNTLSYPLCIAVPPRKAWSSSR
jgi:hypothetical protein